MPTENGSPLFAGFRSERDAASVAALREAGAVIVGKTVTTEFAASEPRGTRNPHDLRRTPGGSSSGSAAGVAAGMMQRRARHAGDRLDHSSGQLLRLRRLQGRRVGALNRGGSYDGLSQSSTGVLAATLGRRLAGRLRNRGARRRRSRLSRPVRPASAPAPKKPRRVAFLETPGWAAASAGRQAGDGGCAGAAQGRRDRGVDARSPTPRSPRSRRRSRRRARSRCGSMAGNRAGRSTPIATGTRASSAASCSSGSPRPRP